jgi:hypothetical protein
VGSPLIFPLTTPSPHVFYCWRAGPGLGENWKLSVYPFFTFFWQEKGQSAALLGKGTIEGQASEWVEVEWVPLLFSHFPYLVPHPFNGQERTVGGLGVDWVKIGS